MRSRFLLAGTAGVASLALSCVACSGPNPPFANSMISAGSGAFQHPLRRRASMGYDAKKPLLFVANSFNNTVEIYDPTLNNPYPIAAITEEVEGPSATCLDKHGTLYVVNANRNHISIQEYRKGQTAPFQAITTGLSNPAYCAIDGSSNLWVTNIGGPNVTEYPAGSTSPGTVITNGITYPIGLAFDRQGDMFVSNRRGGSKNNVQVYAPGATSPSRTITDGITEPSGIAVDSKGTLYVTNLGYNAVPEYKAGQSTPFQTIVSGIDNPDAATVNKQGTLFVSNFSDNTITEYAPGSLYPTGYSISNSLDGPGGSAYSPPLLPKKNPRAVVARTAPSYSDLLYLTDKGSGDLYVYTYPAGNLVQQFQYAPIQDPAGDCVDDRGNVFVTGYNGHDILVYAHGASQTKMVLKDPGYPLGCSIDPTTHNLAVANADGANGGAGNVAIWRDPITIAGTGGPTMVFSNLQFSAPQWCAYDNQGNLFVDGADYSQRNVSLIELPKGTTSFESITLGLDLGWPAGNVQWDGQYITISAGNTIYQLSFLGSTAYVAGMTQLPLYWTLQGYSVAGAWPKESKRTLVATAGGLIGLFRYPSGKGPTKTISQNWPFVPVLSPAL